VSNVGAGQIDFFTAIINPPQLAILSIGSVLPRPVVVGSQLEVRPTVGITLGVDHRAIDGRQSALFLDELKGHLETDKW
jgi:pyruvate/2-oxoglutarate dehydrogenase complex dihydrolipoamide acyltransferase (E2) component